MITALDSSVLSAIIKEESGYESWLDVLMTAASEGALVVSPVVFAELAPSTSNEVELLEFLSRLAISYEHLTPMAAHLAGMTFKRYRQAGGPRQHLVPDFIIAAHAQIQADRLAAIDRGYLREGFPNSNLSSREAGAWVVNETIGKKIVGTLQTNLEYLNGALRFAICGKMPQPR